MRKVLRSFVALFVAMFVAAFFTLGATLPAHAATLPAKFIKLAAAPILAKPGIIVIDPATEKILYANRSDVGRAPASVLKLVSMTAALKVFGSDKIFHTSLYESNKPDTYLLSGESDPWLTASLFEAGKYHRAFSPSLINALIKDHPGVRTFAIDYNGVYTADIQILKRYFSGRVTLNFHSLSSAAAATSEMGSKIAAVASPPLSAIAEFTLLWSDNLLADRLARTAARQLGHPTSAAGIQQTFEDTLASLGIHTTGLVIKDGNGLSKETRISTRTIAELLVKIKQDPLLQDIYLGLPVAGETGTLKSRFVTDAPHAVGLVKAKTGWINGTVSLAGYVTVGSAQYVFAVIADHIKPTEYSRTLARESIDQMLASIARS